MVHLLLMIMGVYNAMESLETWRYVLSKFQAGECFSVTKTAPQR